jgi:hypothetical protein
MEKCATSQRQELVALVEVKNKKIEELREQIKDPHLDCVSFKRIRYYMGINPHRGDELKLFLKAKSGIPNSTFHHAACSIGSLKTSDLFGTSVEGREHFEKQKNKKWILEQVPIAIYNNILFIEYLLRENRDLKKIRGAK